MSVILLLFWITFGTFAVDVVLGKVGVMTGGAVQQNLSDVTHFLLLALSAVFLTAECLRREAQRDGARQRSEPAGSTEPEVR